MQMIFQYTPNSQNTVNCNIDGDCVFTQLAQRVPAESFVPSLSPQTIIPKPVYSGLPCTYDATSPLACFSKVVCCNINPYKCHLS
jgi:hypothetical protein